MKARLITALLVLFAVTPALASAQSPSVQWNRWDAQITVPASGNQMQIAETQEVNVTGGTVNHGTRSWTTPVTVQNVYLIVGSDGTPQQLTLANSNQPNTYSVTQTADGTSLEYTLPTGQNSGKTYIVQINYLAAIPTTGLVDWNVVPGDHAFPVASSTVTFHFPDGQAPDSSLVNVMQGSGTATINGNDVIIKSQGAIPPQQAFEIQVPFGAGVGAAGQSGSSNTGVDNGNTSPANPINPTTDTGSLQLPGIGTILLVICVLGVLVLFGGGSLLRGLLGSFLGGGSSPLGGLGNIGSQSGGNTFGDNESQGQIQRGFRPSSGGQDRQLPHVGNDKNSGGGASFS